MTMTPAQWARRAPGPAKGVNLALTWPQIRLEQLGATVQTI
ncbi:MAG: hypothetical protein ACLRZH_02910 [Ruthenibacterium lactatiformans]